MHDPRFVGRARQSDPPVFEFGVPRRCRVGGPMSRGSRLRREAYLDWNATAPLRPQARAAITAAIAACGNPSSVHRWGRAARRRVEESRKSVARLVGAAPE